MIATNELRFVEREVSKTIDWDVLGHPIAAMKVKVQVLQQKWENTYWTIDESGGKFIEHEWRDVPIEKETDRG